MANSNHLWAFLIIALIAGVSIGFAVSNNGMTGDAALPIKTSTPILKTATVVPDAITWLNNAAVIDVYVNTSDWQASTATCNQVCASAVCVNADIELGTGLMPVTCAYVAVAYEHLYCRCASSQPVATSYSHTQNERQWLNDCVNNLKTMGKEAGASYSTCHNILNEKEMWGVTL